MPPHLPQPGEEIAPPVESALSRRRVLLGMAAGVVVAGSGLAACGSDEPSGAQEPRSDSPATTEPPTSPGSSASPSETGTGEAGIAQTADIPVGGGMIFEDERVVVTQPSTGDFRAFSAVCTHQGCTVGSIRDGLITCPCHGSQYRMEDGSVARGPATAALAEREITVQNGSIVLS